MHRKHKYHQILQRRALTSRKRLCALLKMSVLQNTQKCVFLHIKCVIATQFRLQFSNNTLFCAE